MDHKSITRDSPEEERIKFILDHQERQRAFLKRLKVVQKYHLKVYEQAQKDQADKILIRFYSDIAATLEDQIEEIKGYLPEEGPK